MDDWWEGKITTSERRQLYSQWLGEAHAALDPELIRNCFKKTGCCLDVTGKENEKVKIDQVQTFEVPKLGDAKMKKLTPAEIENWELRETEARTARIEEHLA